MSAARPVQAADALDCRRDELTLAVPAAGAIASLSLRADQPAWLTIEEDGRDLEWRVGTEAPFTPISTRPPRLGLTMATVQDGDRLQLRAIGTNPLPTRVRLRLDCAPAPEVLTQAACLDVLQARRVGWRDVRAWATAQVATPCRAFALHESAALASQRADYPATLALYGATIEVWRQLGDTARQAAAELGLAEIQSDLGRHANALASASSSAQGSRTAGSDYFAVRADAQRCLQMDYLGQVELDATCLRVPDAFARLGEASEAANAWHNLAAFKLARGDTEQARGHLEKGLAMTGTVTSLVTVRLNAMEAKISSAEGRFPRAVAALQAAFDAAEQAGDRRWRANVLLESARFYQQLSAPLEARVMAEEAEQTYRQLAAPARIAAAQALIARIDLDAGRTAAAASAAESAALQYGQVGMPIEELDAWLMSARAGHAPAWTQMSRLVAETRALSPYHSAAIQIARIEQALLTSPAKAAIGHAERLAALSTNADDIAQWLDIQRLRGRALLRAGDASAAIAVVESALYRHRVLAQAARVPSLRQMLLRQSRPLAALWVDALRALPSTQRPTPAQVRQQLHWLHGAELLSPRVDDVAIAGSLLDRELSQAVLPGSQADARRLLHAQRSLLGPFALDAAAGTTSSDMADVAPEPPPPAGVLRLSYGFGDDGGVLVFERDDALGLLILPEASDLAQRAERLARLVQQRDTPVADLDIAARELASILLPAGLGMAPTQLWIDGDPLLALVPFALLPWPGHTWPMLDDVAVSRRLGVESAADHAPPAPGAIDLLVAARPDGVDSTVLPYLIGAEREPDLIAAAYPQARVREHAGREGGRRQLEHLLTTPGTWLHVAAHGVSRTGIQGLAGLWLSPESSDAAPEFVSWLGLAGRPLAADLVVLNACQLADSDVAAHAAVGFASALAAAGVGNVVAANWQLSDSASAVWVPVFYGALAEPGATPVLALREAQLALRRSRAFRHPFYWAGLGHIHGHR